MRSTIDGRAGDLALGLVGSVAVARRRAELFFEVAQKLGDANPRFQGKNFQRNLELVDEVRRLGVEKHATAGQVALAWLLAQGEDVTAIPGTKHPARVEKNAAAADLHLTDEDLERLDAISPPGRWAGAPRTFGAGANSPTRP